MKNEFNLSDWIEKGSWSYDVVPVKDVKEFIKRLRNIKLRATFNKSDVKKCEADIVIALFSDFVSNFFQEVDKLAGEKLTK